VIERLNAERRSVPRSLPIAAESVPIIGSAGLAPVSG